MRNFFRASVVLLCIFGISAPPSAFAANRDIIALQAQVQQMQEMIVSMQQSNDERYAVMHNMMQQTSDSVGKIAAQMESMQKAAQDQQGSQGNSLQQLSGQMQSMNDSLDELRARLDKLDKDPRFDMQSQQQTSRRRSTTDAVRTIRATAASQWSPAHDQTAGCAHRTSLPPQQAPPLDQLYQSAASDYNAAKYNLASQEFADVIKFYPQSTAGRQCAVLSRRN